MNVRIRPTNLQGDVVIPPSKSLSHRAIIAASLACGRSKISNVMYSEDIKATIKGMRALGAKIVEGDDYLLIDGAFPTRKEDTIDCNESGSTLRFLIPISMLADGDITFVGHNNLVNRPLDIYFDLFNKLGVEYEKRDTYLPLKIKGKLSNGVFYVPGDVSSQFITGLLFSLPLCEGDSKIVITTNLESKGYVDLTIDILKMAGIEIINNNYQEFEIEGNQEYKPFDYIVEGDYSQSAFFLVADALGANINLLNMNPRSYQGDKKIINDMMAFGLDVKFTGTTLSLKGTPSPATIDLSLSPDLGPALTVLSALTKGESYLVGAKRLRIKECDRITCMKEEIEKLGGKIDEHPDSMDIYGVDSFKGATLSSHNDHRVAMALAMASLKTKGEIVIEGAEAVTKSYPNFWEVFKSLGGDIDYE